jgi:exodeoxyribonuclease VII small subunit
MSKMSFEAAMERLEQIVRAMERGDVALEESLKLFQEGTELVRSCAKLLDDAQMQIQMVAQSCGILDVNYFTKKFKKATGRTPKEYRQALETMLAKYTS